MAEYEKKVRKILSQYGCTLKRHGKGDHDIWYSPITNRHVTVDTKIKSRHTANAVLKRNYSACNCALAAQLAANHNGWPESAPLPQANFKWGGFRNYEAGG